MWIDSPKWKYVITAMDGSKPVGAGDVYNPHQRTYSDPLNGMRTASFVMDLDNPRADYALSHDCLCKVYRRNRLDNWDMLLVGDLITTEENDDGTLGGITCTVVDPFWRISKRTIGTARDATTHQATGYTYGTVAIPLDLSTGVADMLGNINSSWFTGVQLGLVTLCGTKSVIGPIYADFCGPNIQLVCATLGGPDFWIEPQEPSGSGIGATIGQMNIGGSASGLPLGARGQVRPLAIFEYGMGRKNVASYKRLRTKQNAANNLFALPPGWPTSIAPGDVIVGASDTASQNNMSRFDDIVGSDVVSQQLRQILCNEELAVRKQPQQQITFVPTTDDPLDYKVDFDVGDVVTARAYNQSTQTLRYNGSVRVYGVTITVDDTDDEAVSLTLIPTPA